MQGDKSKNEVRIHATQKPVLLYQWLLQSFVPVGSSILDTHSGSLSLGIASEDWGCKLTAIEKDTRMFNKAAKRLQWHVNNQKIMNLLTEAISISKKYDDSPYLLDNLYAIKKLIIE